MAQKLGLGTEPTELKIGQSFKKNRAMGFHSVRYDFKPASVDPTQMAKVDIGDNNEVRVTVPHIEGSGKSETVFQGSKKPYQKECVLIIDHITGEITLEKLSYNIQLKKTRSEGGSRKYGQRPITPIDPVTSHKPSNTTMRNSPSQRLAPSPNNVSQISPNRNSSPAQKSPTNLSSPMQISQSSPSMPVFTPQTSSSHPAQSSSAMNYRQRKPTSPVKSSMPTFSQLVSETQANTCEEVGVLTDSGSSTYDSSDSETEARQATIQKPQPVLNIGSKNVPPGKTASVLPSMPQLSQLSEDLQLSESDSD